MRLLLLDLRARGGAVLLNSHLLSEIERVCDRVLFLKGGRLLRTHEMSAGGRRVEVRIANAAQLRARLAQQLPDGSFEGDRFRIPVAGEDVIPALVRQLVEAGAEILEVSAGGAELEELYLQIVEGREPERVVEGREPERVVEGREPERVVEGREPERVVEGREPERVVEGREPERVVEGREPERVVEGRGPERGRT
jgi:ABC-2 type transport system ATP-binding protein